MIKRVLIALLIILLISFLFFERKDKNNILYSWSMDEVIDSSGLIEIAKKFKIKTIYQEFSNTYLESNNDLFLKQMKDLGIDIYYLTGDTFYNSVDIINKIDLLVDYNLKNNYKIKGIVLDIESYLDKDFKGYDDFSNNLSLGYKYAKEKGIYYIVVIPYWLDKKDMQALDKIIKNSDEVSIMNYHISDTYENIKNEIKFVKKYNKKINTIYEVNAKNNNSFKSYREIKNDFRKIRFKYSNIRKAYHYYGSMIKN